MGILALYRHKEILGNSTLKATKKNICGPKKKIPVSDPGPPWPSCVLWFFFFFFFVPVPKICPYILTKGAGQPLTVTQSMKILLFRVLRVFIPSL